VLECVVNISEGRRLPVISQVASAAGLALLDVHRDPHHNRSVLTMASADGEELEAAVRAVADAAVRLIDLRQHDGAHPRIGALDVVPFAPLQESTLDDAVRARDRFANYACSRLSVPCFVYGPERTLPEVRRGAFSSITPDVGGPAPHPSAGAIAVGARPVLVAYNVWLVESDIARARQVARAVRGPAIRALGLSLGDRAQVSMNLVDPRRVGPDAAFDAVASQVPVAGAELVGLLPCDVLDMVPARRWDELDLGADRTIEGRLPT